MEKKELIDLLNRDLGDEHAAILRYLIHAYLEGENTPIGVNLLSRAREEMWHMHWLGMAVCQLGGEPNLKPAPYPYDPTNRATIFKSYVAYEEKLIPHYNGEADRVDDSHVKRVLQREAWESAIHAKKFQRLLGKLKPEQTKGAPGGQAELPKAFLDTLQQEIAAKYTEMLQHIRYSWVFQKDEIQGWQLMDQAMEKMKHLAHFAEEVAGNGLDPKFEAGKIDMGKAIGQALQKALEDVQGGLVRHQKFQKDSETQKHGGLVINLDLDVQQEAYQGAEIKGWMKKK
ncbi:MAG: ferritin-like domain-containing protein [Desulfobacterales bacterium]|nr:ferritin-like domain-containing protein [Desulfobacterales bacterium]